MAKYVAAIDQGTTSTRCMIFDHAGESVGVAPDGARADLPQARLGRARSGGDLGAHRRRSSTARWRTSRLSGRATSPPSASPTSARRPSSGTRTTGEPFYNAIVWQDTRTDKICDALWPTTAARTASGRRPACRWPPTSPAPRSAGSWTTSTARARRPRRATLLFGNIDTWVIWNLTGGVDGGAHVTDVTNASRTMLMDLETLDWDDEFWRPWASRERCCPQIRSSIRGLRRRADRCTWPASRSPATSATSRRRSFGQACFSAGEAKNTYGTGCFMLLNTGTEARPRRRRPADDGRLQDRRRAGRLRPRGLDRHHRRAGAVAARQPGPDRTPRPRSKTLAATVEDNGGIYFVPAFSGLFAPYWRSDARGVIVGLTRYVTKGHIARAALEATAYQTREVLEAMNADSGVELTAAEGRRRHGLQRPADAVPGRHPGRARHPAEGRRDHRPRRGLRGRPGRRLLGQASTTCAPTGARTRRGNPRWTATPAPNCIAMWKKAVTRTFDWV